MAIKGVQSVLVAGAGSIGRGVATSFAQAGFRTSVLSRTPSRLQGQFTDVQVVDSLPATAPDLIIESVPEIADLKIRLYTAIENAYAGQSILATNASGLSLPELAQELRFPEMFLGMHYIFPADSTEFVEIVRISQTADAVVDQVSEAVERCGKTPVILKRPVMGALINRLQHAILREAYYLIDQGIVSAPQVDAIAKRLLGPRMCISGLIEQKDISGLDTHALAQRSIVPHLCRDATPSAALQELYEKGCYGLKSGKGFYDWSQADPAAVRDAAARKVARIISLMKSLEQE